MHLIRHFYIDDPTEYLSMNFTGGILGLISVGLFASPNIINKFGAYPLPSAGLIYRNFSQIGPQLFAALSVVLFSFIVMAAFSLGLRKFGYLRVSLKEEKAGADESTHGEEAEHKPDNGKKKKKKT